MAKIYYTYKSFPNSLQATEYSRERERSAVYLRGMVGILSLGAIVMFLICTFYLFSNGDWENFLSAMFFTILIAFLDAYVFILYDNNTQCNLKIILFEEEATKNFYSLKEQMQTLDSEKRKAELSALKRQFIAERELFKKANRHKNLIFLKKYFLFFFLGMFLSISIIGIIQGVVSLNSNESAISVLLFSIFGFLAFCCLIVYNLPVGKQWFNMIFKKKNHLTDNGKQQYNNDGNLFCRKCGTRLLNDSVYCNKCGAKVE